jgi:hypothetical protein
MVNHPHPTNFNQCRGKCLFALLLIGEFGINRRRVLSALDLRGLYLQFSFKQFGYKLNTANHLSPKSVLELKNRLQNY